MASHEQTQTSDLSGESLHQYKPRHAAGGHVFPNITVADHARAHFGDTIIYQHPGNSSADTLLMRVLNDLYFPENFSRYSSIEDCHSGTYEWILPKENIDTRNLCPDSLEGDTEQHFHAWDSFTDWLEDDRQIYWIAGKPGSGKSTLMKHLFDSLSDTRSCPQSIAVSFWFWEAGVHLEKSLEGCLRALIYHVLKSPLMPVHAIGRISSHLAQANSISNLKKALKEAFLALQYEGIAIKVFLDGVDECGLDAEAVLETFNQLAERTSNLKICISSRPEQRFIDMLDGFSKLRLQDLNRQDIKKVINDDLFSKPLVVRLFKTRQDEKRRLVELLESRAQGVFLWVRLVIRSVLQGITNRDDSTTLIKRLENMPGDLENLYAMMLSRNEGDIKYYKEVAAFYFKLILHHSTTSMVYFCLAINDEKRKELLLPCGWTVDNVARAISREDVAIWINVRTGGFLEISKLPAAYTYAQAEKPYGGGLEFLNHQYTSHIDFIHRTARTYLSTTVTGLNLLSNCVLADPALDQICFEIDLITNFVLPHMNGDLISLEGREYSWYHSEAYDTPSKETFEQAQNIWNELLQQKSLLTDSSRFQSGSWDDFLRSSFPLYDYGTIDYSRVCCRVGWCSFAQQTLQDADHIISASDAAFLVYEAVANNSWLLDDQKDKSMEDNRHQNVKREQLYRLLQYLQTLGADFSAPCVLTSGEHINLLPKMLPYVMKKQLTPEFQRIVRQVAGSGEHSFLSTIGELTCLATSFQEYFGCAAQILFGEFCMKDLCTWVGGTQWRNIKSSKRSRIFVIAHSMQPSGSGVEVSSDMRVTPYQMYGISQKDSDELVAFLEKCGDYNLEFFFTVGFGRELRYEGAGEELASTHKKFIRLMQEICQRSIYLRSLTQALLYMGKTHKQITSFISSRLASLEENARPLASIAQLKIAFDIDREANLALLEELRDHNSFGI